MGEQGRFRQEVLNIRSLQPGKETTGKQYVRDL